MARPVGDTPTGPFLLTLTGVGGRFSGVGPDGDRPDTEERSCACADNWDSMKTVKRRHARRVRYQAVWCEGETKRVIDHNRKQDKEAEMWRTVGRARFGLR